jgi:hypothetical protein
MKHFTLLSTVMFALALALATAGPAEASANPRMLQERVKVALNEMVQEVKASETPADKRAVIDRFLAKAERGSRVAERLPMGRDTRVALKGLQSRFAGYSAELKGTGDRTGVADGDLDAFAGFMQQDLEQAADAVWGGGGIYLSVGAIIIILLILLLVT